jgi:glycosyltransferase involved in cell wall biosynthesis
MAESIERLLHLDDMRERLRQSGFANAKRFTWSACADRHMKIYRQFCPEQN